MKLCVFVLMATFSLQACGSPAAVEGGKLPSIIPWWSVNTGGNIHSGTGSYRLSSSVGQSVAGRAAGANYIIQTGFWNRGIIFVGLEERLIEQVPRVHSICQNYPNPFHRATSIRYALPQSEPVRIEIFNIAGQSVRLLVDEVETPGYRLISWDGRDESGLNLRCGVYFYRMSTPEFQATRKMLLLR